MVGRDYEVRVIFQQRTKPDKAAGLLAVVGLFMQLRAGILEQRFKV